MPFHVLSKRISISNRGWLKVKNVVIWGFMIAAMLFMAAIEGADLPKGVWIFIACVFLLYIIFKKDIDNWLQ